MNFSFCASVGDSPKDPLASDWFVDWLFTYIGFLYTATLILLNSVSVFYSVALYLMTPENKTKKKVKIGGKGKEGEGNQKKWPKDYFPIMVQYRETKFGQWRGGGGHKIWLKGVVPKTLVTQRDTIFFFFLIE